MHELSLLTGVTRTASEAAEGKTIRAVGLTVGSFSGVVIDALDGAWFLARQGTACENAELHIEPVTATVWCPTCQREQPIDEYFDLSCPVCGTGTAELRRGKEFDISYIDVDTDE
ncbi:putative hydrogenase nickel incorporation protein [Corynebacterium renale]|uniref:Hydrogenase maturation factor HypA n=1 Tax=Corynebacterium renale TaxID=1724 RepID=A0A2A9DNW5_9CORY|nr:hydrogenase maturation nickel metallochaperone HypA [Corynebacterium renale]PFG28437.1 hydrogenase-1 and 2 nickel incorporation protein HybF [Corynebacterium renale]SQG64967.1 putative hydrogenase nickel incorporation protein [Corynebacterium renale]SQI26417.1 putative hydrogenase nickel incorporation protein [Corynebacterium renale]STC96906.1 putative hydrogenase nickel incorporation protein [Corynebacterium renale]